MNNSIIQLKKLFKEQLMYGTNELIDSIKLILYKKYPTIFEELDFDNDEIYLEPLLFAGLNSKLQIDVNNLLLGYKNKTIVISEIELKTPNSFELGVFIWDVLIGFLLSQARTQLTFKLTLQFAHDFINL